MPQDGWDLEDVDNDEGSESSPRKAAALGQAVDHGWRSAGPTTAGMRSSRGASSGGAHGGAGTAGTSGPADRPGGTGRAGTSGVRTSRGRTAEVASSQPMSTPQMAKLLEARQAAQRVQDKLDLDFVLQLQEASALKIQAWYRMMRYSKAGPLALVLRKNNRIRKYAATKIQRVYRGHLSRHDPDLELRIEIRRLEHCCAILLQSVTRGHLKRRLVRQLIYQQRSRILLNAVVRVQCFARGWRVRRKQALQREVLKKRVDVIENFACTYFQPWQRRQHALLQHQLERIVTVQSKIRRFIAVKHSRERRKVKHDFAVMGAWCACRHRVSRVA